MTASGNMTRRHCGGGVLITYGAAENGGRRAAACNIYLFCDSSIINSPYLHRQAWHGVK